MSSELNMSTKSISVVSDVNHTLMVNRPSTSSAEALCSNMESSSINEPETLLITNGDENIETGTLKQKNFRKKKKLKKLQIPNTVQSQTHPSQISTHSNSTINKLSLDQDNANNTRYLENVSHHPQFRVTMHSQHMFNNHRYSFSAPTTPLVLGNQIFNQVHPSTAPFPQYNLPSPNYLHNLMQHPLINQSYRQNVIRNLFPIVTNGYQHHKEKSNASPKQNKKKEQKKDEYKYSLYMLKEDVEVGLKNKTLIEGVLRINPKASNYAYVSSYDRSEQDICIDGLKNRNRALEGDIVIVSLVDSDSEESTDGDKRKRGKVVYIKEKIHTRTCIGTMKLMPDKSRQRALFIPRDYRIPRLNVASTFWPNNFYEDSKRYENTLFMAKICDWFDTRFAIGKILCNIGESGDMKSETRAILAQTELDITPFGPDVKHLYPNLDFVISDEELNLREDCRKLCLFSIDPFNCRDIDDAVSCRQLENGNYEVGVHISDVSYFLTENTILDEKVAEKATTIYMVENAYHMLPDELCMLCSLFPGVDKLAFSVFWEITPDARIVNTRFAKTVIQSCCQLAYDHAQAILENKADARLNFPEIFNEFQFDDIAETIKTLGSLAAILRKNRFNSGALSIDQPKVSFRLSPSDGLPESFSIYESKESHQLIEEFMLLANISVAQRIYDDHPKLAFLRCHPQPSVFMLKELAKSLKPMGIDLQIDTAGDLQKSLLAYIGPDADKGKALVLSMLCTKPLARAKYFCAGGDEGDFNHYALNVPLYTHFTSPIRRYADIMVHRLLSASLKYREVPSWEIDYVRSTAAQCNKQKYNAKRAAELSTELYLLKYIELHSPVVTEAAVIDVKEKHIDVIITAMDLNRRIYFNNDFPGEFKCIKNDAGLKLSQMELTWHATDKSPEVKQCICVFSTLKVEMHKGDEMVKIETKLVRPDQS
ncbi:DIS3-like exonuclease 2 [Leptidea sinapis]|uniref:DIS3-like exonuclease 2 n=1 Tax=Leptidea sinapis TaxID=189913 RepID=UPI0021307963|nr:DIS3-like exonuclease 2 [Leptidea sinapis]